jgi:hypothetical protein
VFSEIAAMLWLKVCDRERSRRATIPNKTGNFCCGIQTGPVYSRIRLMDGRAAAPLPGYARQTVGRAA